jgi:hypothetical protein
MINIVEMEFINGTWKFLRNRSDKEIANSYKSIQSAVSAIVDNITIDELSKLKHKKSPYEKANDECRIKTGFNFQVSSINSDVCSFYTYAYPKIIIGSGSLLVIGCDLCLLNGLLNSNYTKIDIYEENCLEVYGCEISEGYIGLKEHLSKQNTSKKINIKWGKPTSLTKYNAVFINNLCDVNIFKTIQKTKLVMGTYLSKERVSAYFKKQPCIVLRNGDLHPLWKLNTTGNNDVAIKRLNNSFTSEKCSIISGKQINVIKSTTKHMSFKTLYTEYKKNGGRLSEYDSIISDIMCFFISENK